MPLPAVVGEGDAFRALHADFIFELAPAGRYSRCGPGRASRARGASPESVTGHRALQGLDFVLVLDDAHGGDHFRARVLERDRRIRLHEALRLGHVIAVHIAHRVAVAVKIRRFNRFARDAAADQAVHAVNIAYIVNAADGARLVDCHAATRPALHIGNRFFDEQNHMRRTMRIRQHERHVLTAQTR